MSNIDSVIRALSKLGLEATGAPQAPKIKQQSDGRKSLMILPFEDLSPTGDNEWFADGIASELISALSNVKALRVGDPQATKEFKGYKGQLSIYAREMGIRYFVQGDVRKFGDSIKITCRLLDIESGDFLWQDSMRGTMQDVFEIQEEVAKRVTDGLDILLTSEEKEMLADRGTDNAEAYELLLKGNEYFNRQSKEGFELAAQLYSEAIAIDPGYARAYSMKANALSNLYRNYDRDSKLLDEGLSLIRKAQTLKPHLWGVRHPLSSILMLQGKLEEAEQAAKDYIRNAPEEYGGHFALGFFYQNTGQHAKAIAPYEEAVRLRPDDLPALFNLVLACKDAQEETANGPSSTDNRPFAEKQRTWSLFAIPKVEKHLKLFPNNENWRVNYALLLHKADRDEEARAAAQQLTELRDGKSLYNLACLQCILNAHVSGISTFRMAMEVGFRNMGALQSFLDDEDEGIGELKGTPEYEEVKRLVENIERKSTNA
jgi:adenylate cyclase